MSCTKQVYHLVIGIYNDTRLPYCFVVVYSACGTIFEDIS